MSPTLRQGDIVVVVGWARYVLGDIVMARVNGREVIKRVSKVDHYHVWLVGDNPTASTDSRHYGPVDKSAILGVMRYTLPASQPAPKLRNKHGVLLGWIAAGIMIAFAVIHLFRIDTFVPEFSKALGGNRTLTLWMASSVVIAEVFALPFLLRMRLSPLAQYISGAFGVAVPLVWLLVAVWTYGGTVSTAQLGEFKSLPSSWLLIVANSTWLVFAYFILWALGYDHRPRERQSFVTRWLTRISK